MISSEQLQKIRTEARPLIEQQMDIALQLAAMRDVVATAGGDWSALKAVIKAEIQDKVAKVRDKAESTLAYADMLGLGNMNEFFNSADDDEITHGNGNVLAELGIESADRAPAVVAAAGGEGSENAPATVDTLHPQPASLAGLPGATAPGERIKEPAHSDLSEVGAVGEGGRAALAVAAEPGGEGGQANAFPAARVMSMTPLEPRTAGGLKGFGFTVSFDERPVVAGGVQVPFEGAINQ